MKCTTNFGRQQPQIGHILTQCHRGVRICINRKFAIWPIKHLPPATLQIVQRLGPIWVSRNPGIIQFAAPATRAQMPRATAPTQCQSLVPFKFYIFSQIVPKFIISFWCVPLCKSHPFLPCLLLTVLEASNKEEANKFWVQKS